MIYRLLPHRKPKEEVDEPAVPSVGNRDRQFRGLFAGVPLIVGLVIVTLLAMLLFLHSQFMARVAQCREVYATDPPMEVVTEQQAYFLQPYGVLRTELYSPDPPAETRERMGRAYGAIMRRAVTSGDFSNLPEQAWSVVRAEDGGSMVTLTCP